MREITGQDVTHLLNREIVGHRGGITNALSPLDARSATYAWIDTIRAVEEFINLPLFGLNDDPLEQQIVRIRLDTLTVDPRPLAPVRQALIERFGDGVAQRFVLTLLQATAIGAAFRQHGLFEAASGFLTVGHAVGYFQSRRRHLVALLYTMPSACRGDRPVERLDTLNLFLPLVELNGIALTGLFQQLMLARVFADHKLTVDQHGYAGNHSFEPLDRLFLEPERAAITEMQAARTDPTILERLEPVDPQPHEPAEQQVELQPLHQLPLRADRIERLQEHRPQQHLRRDRRPAHPRIKPRERRCQALQRRVGKPPDRPQRMVEPNPRLQVYQREQRPSPTIRTPYPPSPTAAEKE